MQHSVDDGPKVSIRHRTQQLILCPFTLWKIWGKDFGLLPYKIQLAHKLKPHLMFLGIKCN